ncbi:MAG: hypothetical protein L3K26_12215 [Candidatus Hydrogenedentes bacterium]|nr:hypothetical protein [Candidatus Hydrogenedentota bacterium]
MDTTDIAPRLTKVLVLFIMVATTLLALPRFAHTTPDSIYYTDLVDYFRGTLPRESLHTPFAFRWVVPRIASALPGVPPHVAMALCSVLATIASYLVAARLLANLLRSQTQLIAAVFLLVLSFSTVNYASAVLTDAAGFLVLVSACYAMQQHRYLLLGGILVVGTGVRESTLLMLPVLWIFLYLQPRSQWVLTATGLSAITLLAALASRWYFADLPAYFWTPTWSRFADNMARPVSWATVTLTLGPLLLALAATRRSTTPLPRDLRAFIIAIALPSLLLIAFSTTAAFMSGRFCWPLYLALVPLVAWRIEPRCA